VNKVLVTVEIELARVVWRKAVMAFPKMSYADDLKQDGGISRLDTSLWSMPGFATITPE